MFYMGNLKKAKRGVDKIHKRDYDLLTAKITKGGV